MEKVIGLILSGGKETRFGPMKRYIGPKILVDLKDRKPVIIETIERMTSIVSKNDTFIITNNEYMELLKKEIQAEILNSNYIIEPEPKDTAVCIIFAILNLLSIENSDKKKEYSDDTIIIISPSDHDIVEKEKFVDVIEETLKYVNDKNIILLGKKPEYSSSSYGYITTSDNSENNLIDNVTSFVEKPQQKEALEIYESENVFWNLGIYIAKIRTIINYYKKHQVDLFNQVKNIFDRKYADEAMRFEALKILYRSLNGFSNFDKEIIQNIKDPVLFMKKCYFKWSDIGKWNALVSVQLCVSNDYKKIMIMGIDLDGKTAFVTGKIAFDSKYVNDGAIYYRILYSQYSNKNKDIEDVILKELNKENTENPKYKNIYNTDEYGLL